MNKRGHIKLANSASCGDFSHLRKARFLDKPSVLSVSLASHKCENSSTILEFASCVEGAESSEKFKSKKPFKSFCYFWLLPKVESPLSFNHNLPSKADSQNLIKNQVKKSSSKFLLLLAFAKSRVPPNFIDSNLPNKADSQNLQGGLPRRFCESARNDKFLDYSHSTLSTLPHNDNLKLDSVDFTLPKQEANSSIVDEFSHLCEASDADRTNGSSRKRALCNCEKSPQDEFALV